MKKKTKEALRGLLESVRVHESETEYSAVEVDKEELKRLLRWAQNKSYVWFKGDRMESTGAMVWELPWLEEGMQGTAMEDSNDEAKVWVEWDDGPEGGNRAVMFHNEVRRIKG